MLTIEKLKSLYKKLNDKIKIYEQCRDPNLYDDIQDFQFMLDNLNGMFVGMDSLEAILEGGDITSSFQCIDTIKKNPQAFLIYLKEEPLPEGCPINASSHARKS